MVFRCGCFFLVLLTLLPSATAQHSGRRGTSSGAGTGTASPDGADLDTFKRAIAVQATEVQTEPFHTMSKSTETAKLQAHALAQQAAASGDSVELTHKATALQNAVVQLQADYQAFRRSLSDAQEAGLKEQLKKLSKADAAVAKAEKALEQELEHVPVNAAKLPGAGGSLEKALDAFQAEQVNIGKQMGIPQQ